MKNIFFLTIFSVSILNACHKPSQPYYAINASLKAAFDFQPGTYWIYKDSISGEVDSFAVLDNQGSGTLINSSGGYSLEHIIFQTQEYSSSGILQLWNYNFYGDEIELEYFNTNMIGTEETDYMPLVNYPFQYTLTYESFVKDELLKTADSSQVYNIYSSYSLNGNLFANVAVVNHRFDNNVFALDYNDVFYICPNIGIIKMKLSHPLDSINRVWELQRWNVVM